MPPLRPKLKSIQRSYHEGPTTIGLGRVPASGSAPAISSSSRNPDETFGTPRDTYAPQHQGVDDQDLFGIGIYTASAASQDVEHIASQDLDGSLHVASSSNTPGARAHNGRRFHCQREGCNKSYSAKQSLKRHERIHHRPDTCERFYCPVSDCIRHHEPFFRRDMLVRHQKDSSHFVDSVEQWTPMNPRHATLQNSFSTGTDQLDQSLQADSGSAQIHRQPLRSLSNDHYHLAYPQPGQPFPQQLRDALQDQPGGQTGQSAQSPIQLKDMPVREQRERVLDMQSDVQGRQPRLRAEIERLQMELTRCESIDALIIRVMRGIDDVNGP